MNRIKSYFMRIELLMRKHLGPQLGPMGLCAENKDKALSALEILRDDEAFQEAKISCSSNDVPYPHWFVRITKKYEDGMLGTYYGDNKSLCLAICTAVLRYKYVAVPKEPKDE